MKTINLGKIIGVNTRIHWTFWLLPIWIFLTSLGSGGINAIGMVLFVFAVFGCVLLHELGHALAARQLGIGTRDIVLYPIGGVASLERMPTKPLHELWIAIAGPLVNVVLAILLAGFVFAGGIPASTFGGALLWRLLIANIILVVFNLIPAFPMDGGRVLRSVLAMMMDFRSASRIAVVVGKVAAIGFALLGLFTGNFMLILVGGFVFLAGQAELAAIEGRFTGQQFANDQPLAADSWTSNASNHECVVPATLPVASVVAWLNELRSDTCKVVQAGQTIGRISKNQLVVAVSNGFGRTPVGALVQ